MIIVWPDIWLFARLSFHVPLNGVADVRYPAAGPDRVAEWRANGQYRDVNEFVESIPFTETRDYVQAVLRNAEMYRRLY